MKRVWDIVMLYLRRAFSRHHVYGHSATPLPAEPLPEVEQPSEHARIDPRERAHLEHARREHDLRLAKLRALARVKGSGQ
jgi:hypothetical protein